VGDEDEKFQGIAAILEEGCFDARTAIVSESGHAAHLEQPEAFAVLVKDFLARAGCAQPGGDVQEDERDE
jgi:2-succinyl-6-hydroxy-2,4-cyclohexadiene-1-carboxylate synthase